MAGGAGQPEHQIEAGGVGVMGVVDDQGHRPRGAQRVDPRVEVIGESVRNRLR